MKIDQTKDATFCIKPVKQRGSMSTYWPAIAFTDSQGRKRRFVRKVSLPEPKSAAERARRELEELADMLDIKLDQLTADHVLQSLEHKVNWEKR